MGGDGLDCSDDVLILLQCFVCGVASPERRSAIQDGPPPICFLAVLRRRNSGRGQPLRHDLSGHLIAEARRDQEVDNCEDVSVERVPWRGALPTVPGVGGGLTEPPGQADAKTWTLAHPGFGGCRCHAAAPLTFSVIERQVGPFHKIVDSVACVVFAHAKAAGHMNRPFRRRKRQVAESHTEVVGDLDASCEALTLEQNAEFVASKAGPRARRKTASQLSTLPKCLAKV